MDEKDKRIEFLTDETVKMAVYSEAQRKQIVRLTRPSCCNMRRMSLAEKTRPGQSDINLAFFEDPTDW